MLGVGLIAAFGGWLRIERFSAPHLLDLEHAPPRPVALVLGAHVRRDGPSDMLEDRLATALELYRSGRCESIILSGAHHRHDHDEVSVMRRWMEARGVDPDDLFLDHAGLRTFDSMVRAREVFGAERILVVTQRYHLPRAVYIARHVGLDAVGVAAPPGHRYSRSLKARNQTRERAAQLFALLDLHVLGTEPRHLGPPIDLSSPGRTTH